MSIETITLNLGERIMGYTLFKGYITSSIYFRFTIPENQLDKVKKGQEINIHIPYKNKDIKGITTIKQLGAEILQPHILIMKCRKACLK
jgi:HlyD family secretion protein